MLDRETIINLKNVNASKDAEKTKERIRAAWVDLSKDRRDEILALADLSKITVERAYKSGSASIRLIAAFSQVLSINPYYLIGQTDKPEPYEDEQNIQLLTELGYGNLIKTSGVRAKRTKKAEKPATVKADVIEEQKPLPQAPQIEDVPEKAEETQSVEANVSVAAPEALCNTQSFDEQLNALSESISEEQKTKMGELSEDDLMLLLKGQLIKSKMNKEKANHFTLIKYMLLQ
jgi:hypothetical protein